jgi:hypothetical protein
MWDMMEHMMEQKMFPQAANQPPEGWEYEKVNQAVPGPQPSSEAASQDKPKGTPPGWDKEEQEEKENV